MVASVAMRAAVAGPARAVLPARRRGALAVRAATALPAEVRTTRRAMHGSVWAMQAAGAQCLTPLPNLQVKTVTPVGDRVFVKAEEAESKTVGGILLPSSAQKRPTQGTVESAGSAKAVKVGAAPLLASPLILQEDPIRPAPAPLQAGDKVVYSKYAGTELELQGGNYVLLKVRRGQEASRAGGGTGTAGLRACCWAVPASSHRG